MKRIHRRRCLPIIAMLMAAGISWTICEASPESVPEEVRSQWKFNAEQVSLRWDAEREVLTFRQSAKKVIIRGPSDLYRLPYRLVFEADKEESAVLLVLGKDGNPTHLTGKILEQNEAVNPQVHLVNPAGVVIGTSLDSK